MGELPKRRIWLPSVDLLVFLGIGVIVSAICIPGLTSASRASNERNASTSLKTLTSAEADFRAKDRDGNHVNDFWTGDVSGLYHVKSGADNQTEIRLIEESVADSDPKPLFPSARGLVPKAGYFHMALDRDDNFEGPEGEYRRDTDKSGRKVHHESRFGFSAYPKDDGSGNYAFFVNENNTIFRVAGSKPKKAFPNDQQFLSTWSRMD